jgi:hypothetical protein
MIFEVEKTWTDCCHHKPDEYVGSFECLGEKYDLYAFYVDNNKQHFCIRFGNEAPDYFAPFGVENIIRAAAHEQMYADAWEMLQSKGRLIWSRKSN